MIAIFSICESRHFFMGSKDQESGRQRCFGGWLPVWGGCSQVCWASLGDVGTLDMPLGGLGSIMLCPPPVNPDAQLSKGCQGQGSGGK